MNLFLWMLTGAMLGWAAFSMLALNEPRGTLVSMVIGGIGGVVGGKLVAPMFLAVATNPADFSMSALLFAAAFAAASLVIGNLVSNRWGV